MLKYRISSMSNLFAILQMAKGFLLRFSKCETLHSMELFEIVWQQHFCGLTWFIKRSAVNPRQDKFVINGGQNSLLTSKFIWVCGQQNNYTIKANLDNFMNIGLITAIVTDVDERNHLTSRHYENRILFPKNVYFVSVIVKATYYIWTSFCFCF